MCEGKEYRNRIENILRVDRSGSVVLEEVIRCGGSIKELNGVGFVELIITGSWYLWWERRQIAYGENVQRVHQTALAIAAIPTNYMLAMQKGVAMRKLGKVGPNHPKEKLWSMWMRPLIRCLAQVPPK